MRCLFLALAVSLLLTDHSVDDDREFLAKSRWVHTKILAQDFMRPEVNVWSLLSRLDGNLWWDHIDHQVKYQ